MSFYGVLSQIDTDAGREARATAGQETGAPVAQLRKTAVSVLVEIYLLMHMC
jgi:hypothetical protein